MPPALRPIGHEDKLSLVEHLDELRTRLLICVAAFVAAFAICAWQNDALLDVINRPLEKTTRTAGNEDSGGRLEQGARSSASLRRALDDLAAAAAALAGQEGGRNAAAELERAARSLRIAAAQLPREPPGRQPVTLGVGEPFVTTITVAAWFALLIALPLILYQAYAFVLPALSPKERRAAVPLMAMVPVLFIGGVVFGYFVVLPPAIRFLQNFNDDSFDVLVQAKDYYRFAVMSLLAMGALFQMPVGILTLTRVGVLTPAQLRANRRYAIVIMAVVAMLLPGTDPVTMILALVPLLLLFELSILLASAADRRRAEEEASDPLSDDED